MAFRIGSAVERGEVDNRVRGQVVGKIWLRGRDTPLSLELKGDCLRDLAGCLLRFENPQAELDESLVSLAGEQCGEVGDITASKKVRVLLVDASTAYEMKKRGEKVPERRSNALYLEWFSCHNGRVVIESADYHLDVSVPEWRMTEDEELNRCEENSKAMRRFLSNLTERLDRARRESCEACEAAHDRPLDEFGWEKVLRNSDAVTDKYLELMDKHGESPEAEDKIAREMGWSGGEEERKDDSGKRDQLGEWKEDFFAGAEDGWDEYEEPPPDPSREGIDWVRNAHGDLVHPLVERASRLGLALFHAAEAVDESHGERQKAAHDLAFQAELLGAKLAGALNGITTRAPDSGFIVACLKRILPIIDKGFALLAAAENGCTGLPMELLAEAKEEFFAIREKVLAIMTEHRGKG